jgi:hypothetical protein
MVTMMKYNVSKFHSLLAKAHLELGPDAGPTALADRFAELLVRECIDVLSNDDGATHHEQLLLEHFGVK